jgi:hypothetical protein
MPTLLQDLFSRHPVAGERPQAVLPIPYGERPTDFRWNSDPLDFDGGYGGSEMDAGYFVLPYWMVNSARCRAIMGWTRSFLRRFWCQRLLQGRFHRFIKS